MIVIEWVLNQMFVKVKLASVRAEVTLVDVSVISALMDITDIQIVSVSS